MPADQLTAEPHAPDSFTPNINVHGVEVNRAGDSCERKAVIDTAA